MSLFLAVEFFLGARQGMLPGEAPYTLTGLGTLMWGSGPAKAARPEEEGGRRY